jgi:hypothetical protein
VQYIFDKDYLITNSTVQILVCAVRKQTGWFACGLKAMDNEQWESGV